MANKKQLILNSLILFIVALTIRLIIIAFHGFDGLYGQDAFEYYDFAQDLLDFVQSRNPPRPFAWSLGYPTILSLAFLVFGISESIALSISLIMGGLLPVMVYIISLQFRIRSTYAFTGGVIIAFSGQVIQSSLVIMSDVPALFMSLFSLLCLLKYIQTKSRLWLIIGAFALSFACVTRLIYLVIPTIYIIVIVMTMTSKRRIVDFILVIPFALGPVVPQFIFNRYNPTNLLSHSWVDGWSLSNMLSQNFVNVDGTFHYEGINAIFYAYPAYDGRYLSPLLTLFFVIGIFTVLRSKVWHHIVLLLGWLLLPYLFLAGIPYQNIRFPLIALPIIVVLVLYGLQKVIDSQWRVKQHLRWGIVALALAGIFHTSMLGVDYANSFVEHHQSEKAVIDWLDSQIPDDVTLYTFGMTLTLEHYTDLNIIEIFYETPNTLNQRWFRGRSDYVLLNIWQIENQWQGRDPQANYHWFRDERGLTELGRFRNLTLFEANE